MAKAATCRERSGETEMTPKPDPTLREFPSGLTQEMVDTWKAAYIARFVEVGFEVEHGIADYEGDIGGHDYNQNPVEAADEALSYYDDDGDLA
jgi:hypothetical protein